MNVRPAKPEDAHGIRTVAEAAWWAVYPGVVRTDNVRMAIDDLYDINFLRDVINERDDLLFLTAEEEGEMETHLKDGSEATIIDDGEDSVWGFVSAQQTWADEVEVHALFVHPDRWGEGTGTALLEAVEDSALAANVDRLRVGVLSGNSVGRAFVETRGFKRVETLTTQIGDETVPEDVFEKKL